MNAYTINQQLDSLYCILLKYWIVLRLLPNMEFLLNLLPLICLK